MSDLPPSPYVSPDGKFYWDGQSWVPMPGQAVAEPPPSIAEQPAPVVRAPAQAPAGLAQKAKGYLWRNRWIAIGGLVAAVVVVVIVIVIGQGAAGTGPPAPQHLLLDQTGSGTNTTARFTAGADWHIDWSYDCSSFAPKGTFAIYVFDNAGSAVDVAANQLGASGSATSNERRGGTFYLQVNSQCNWHVMVKG